MQTCLDRIIENKVLADTHCHLHDPLFEEAGVLPDVFDRAKKTGLGEIWLVSTDKSSARRNIEIISKYRLQFPELKLRLGIGIDMEALVPGSDLFQSALFEMNEEDIGKYASSTLESLMELAKGNGVEVDLAGEIGLDYYWLEKNAESKSVTEHSKAMQKAMLMSQLRFASTYSLPVSLHSRGAEEQVIDIIEEFLQEAPLQGIFHSFTAPREQMSRIRDLEGFYIGVNGIVTYTSARQLRQDILSFGEIRSLNDLYSRGFVLETDAPYLIPANSLPRPVINEPGQINSILSLLISASSEV